MVTKQASKQQEDDIKIGILVRKGGQYLPEEKGEVKFINQKEHQEFIDNMFSIIDY